MRRLVTLLVVLTILSPVSARVTQRASAAGLVDVSIGSADIKTGRSLAGACYIILDWSEEGCDENSDGKVEFAGVKPGSYTVTQTHAPGGYMTAGDFPIVIKDSKTATFGTFLLPTVYGEGNFDISITPFDQFSNEDLAGACFILNGGSEEGCDVNNDTKVDFKAVHSGTYLVTETRAPDGYGPPDDFWISVSAKSVLAMRVPTAKASSLPDIAIESVNDETDELVIGACYVIIDWSEEGCDQNGDGQVEFAGVKPGKYMVTQTKSPAGYVKPDDFQITVQNRSNQVFPVRLAYAPVVRDVAIVSRDAQTGNRLVGACYIIDGASLEGCDENNDGQVDFKDVTVGTFTIIETKAPAGYSQVLGTKITITESNSGGVQLFSINHRKK